MDIIRKFQKEIGIEFIKNREYSTSSFWRAYKEKLIKEERVFYFIKTMGNSKEFLNPERIREVLHTYFKVYPASFFEDKSSKEYLHTCFPVEEHVNRVGASAIIAFYLESIFQSKIEKIRRQTRIFKDPKIIIARVINPVENFNGYFYCEEAFNFIVPILRSRDGFVIYDPIDTRYRDKLLKILGKENTELESVGKAIFTSMFLSYIYSIVEENPYASIRDAILLKKIMDILKILRVDESLIKLLNKHFFSKYWEHIGNSLEEKAHYIKKGKKFEFDLF